MLFTIPLWWVLTIINLVSAGQVSAAPKELVSALECQLGENWAVLRTYAGGATVLSWGIVDENCYIDMPVLVRLAGESRRYSPKHESNSHMVSFTTTSLGGDDLWDASLEAKTAAASLRDCAAVHWTHMVCELHAAD